MTPKAGGQSPGAGAKRLARPWLSHEWVFRLCRSPAAAADSWPSR